MTATARQGFDIGASLLGLHKDIPYVTKLGYVVGEVEGCISLWVIVEGVRNDDEFYEYSMAAVRKALDFEDMMPARMREEYEVLPFVTDPDEGALLHFRTTTAVIDRKAAGAAAAHAPQAAA